MEDNKEKLAPSEETAEEATAEAAKTAEAGEEAAGEAVEEAAEDATVEVPAEEIKLPPYDGETVPLDGLEISPELQELQTAVTEKPKKKRKLMAPIIVSVVIVAVAAIAALVLTVFFGKGIDGCWKFTQEVQTNYAQSTSDQPDTVKITYYFNFEGGNKLTVKSGTATGSGTYTFRTGSVEGEPIGEPVVDMDFIDPISNQPISSTFKAVIEGNIFTGKKLTLTSIQNEQFKMELEKEDYKQPELKREGEFSADKQIEGKWVTSQQGMGVTYITSYELKSDGTFVVISTQKVSAMLTGAGKDLEYTTTIEGIYSCEKEKLSLNFYTTEAQKAEIAYTIKEKGNVLTLKSAQDMDFYKVGSASADEVLNPPTTQAATEAATQAATQAATKAK